VVRKPQRGFIETCFIKGSLADGHSVDGLHFVRFFRKGEGDGRRMYLEAGGRGSPVTGATLSSVMNDDEERLSVSLCGVGRHGD
jgi:hypothetical protein